MGKSYMTGIGIILPEVCGEGVLGKKEKADYYCLRPVHHAD